MQGTRLSRPGAHPFSQTPGIAAIERLVGPRGILQHSRYATPDPAHGYCVDDNARALILMHRSPGLSAAVHDPWAKLFGGFVAAAWNGEAGAFRNFMDYDGGWLEDGGSEDSQGRALWSLGVTAAEARAPAQRAWGRALFDEAVAALAALDSPRAMAFCILGAVEILGIEPGHRHATRIVTAFTGRLCRIAADEARPGWPWFERRLAYDNARLPEALLRAGVQCRRDDLVAHGLEALAWLVGKQTAPEGHFRPVGSTGFARDYAEPEPYDQQPLEAQGMIEACAAAFAASGDPQWVRYAETAFAWFLGGNDGGVALADFASGECYDGLTPDGPNLNGGAESVLAFQLGARALSRLLIEERIS